MNLYLGKRGLEVKDLQYDFSDGVLLCNLMEVISGKKLPSKYPFYFYRKEKEKEEEEEEEVKMTTEI